MRQGRADNEHGARWSVSIESSPACAPVGSQCWRFAAAGNQSTKPATWSYDLLAFRNASILTTTKSQRFEQVGLETTANREHLSSASDLFARLSLSDSAVATREQFILRCCPLRWSRRMMRKKHYQKHPVVENLRLGAGKGKASHDIPLCFATLYVRHG